MVGTGRRRGNKPSAYQIKLFFLKSKRFSEIFQKKEFLQGGFLFGIIKLL